MTNKEVKALQKNSPLTLSQFLKSGNLALHELKTEQISQLSQDTLAVRMCALKDGRIQKPFSCFFCDRNFSFTLQNNARVL